MLFPMIQIICDGLTMWYSKQSTVMASHNEELKKSSHHKLSFSCLKTIGELQLPNNN